MNPAKQHKKLIKLAKTIPDAAPTNNAGEKTPPKKPVDKQTAVRTILRKRKTKTVCVSISALSILFIVVVPIPKTSG